jgi:CRISPR-associated protein Cas2
MYLVLCYDVVSDRRRTRLYGKLKGFLRPVQKSVFEGELPDRRYQDLKDVIENIIDQRVDTVRVYHLCKGCRPLADIIGTGTIIDGGQFDLIL